MIFGYLIFAGITCFISLTELANGYRILGVFPSPSISHQVVFRSLTLALNKRGHELVIITPDPIEEPNLQNYTEIDISDLYETFERVNFIDIRRTSSWVEFLEQYHRIIIHILEKIHSDANVQKLYAPGNNEKFDLVIVEVCYWQSLYPLAKVLDAPLIGIQSFSLGANVHYAIGNPVMPSHHSTWELGSQIYEPLTFWQRLKNFIYVWKFIYWCNTSYHSVLQAIATKYFGNDVGDLREFEKNMSLLFVNRPGPISYARPNVPKVIEVSGFDFPKQIASLPKDLAEILNGATNGFIYVSLGTNVPSAAMSNETLNAFIHAFARLPYKVLWKFEKDILPGKPNNVHIMRWVPQQAVLAHTNIKVFVYQGGLQSTEEAITHAVPVVGFPVVVDQDMQINKLTSLGVAKRLEITAVDGNELFEAIITVATDTSYRQKMLSLRTLMADKPFDPLENAIWWTEYVIRHRGAPHLQSSTADEPWYRRQDIDIVAFLSVGSATILSLTLIIFYRFISGLHACAVSRLFKKMEVA